MYPPHHETRLLCPSITQNNDYDDDYDVYLFWPSYSPHLLVPLHAGHVDVRLFLSLFVLATLNFILILTLSFHHRCRPLILHHTLVMSWNLSICLQCLYVLFPLLHSALSFIRLARVFLQTFSPTFSFDSDFVFPDSPSLSGDGMGMDGYSRVFRMGLVSKVEPFRTRS